MNECRQKVIHKTTIRQCIDAKSCMFVINKSIVKAILLPLFLSAVWTLILTAPIHFRGSIGNQVMYYYIYPNIFLWRNNIDCRAVKILDFSYHCYCGYKNSQYRYIAISIETLGGGGGICQIIFLLCLLSFCFSPTEHKDTEKHRAQDSGFLCLLWSSFEITRDKIL